MEPGSVVNKPMPAYTRIGGIPAKVIGELDKPPVPPDSTVNKNYLDILTENYVEYLLLRQTLEYSGLGI